MTYLDKVGPRNEWRLKSPGIEGWSRTAHPTDPAKYFMVSCDNHVNEPFNWAAGRISDAYKDRMPRMVKDAEGNEWLHSDGRAPHLVKPVKTKTDHLQPMEKYETWEVMVPYTSRMEEMEMMKSSAGRNVAERIADAEADGVDAEFIYPQKGGLGFATRDTDFSLAMTRAWNRWALDEFGATFGRTNPAALITTANIPEAVKEVQWAASNGFRSLSLPNKPIFGPTQRGELAYNHNDFDPLWAAIAETGLVATFHVSSGGEDPRGAGGNGGAIINYVTHSMITTLDPLVKVITSGVLERNPTLKVVTVESGVGWLPWLLETMDHAYRSHHMWVRPVIPELPSFYYRRNCASTFMEEAAGLKYALDYGLEDNLLWANDYPHHEGSFPFSAQAIERMMGGLTETQRAKVLGLNAARVFGLTVPKSKA